MFNKIEPEPFDAKSKFHLMAEPKPPTLKLKPRKLQNKKSDVPQILNPGASDTRNPKPFEVPAHQKTPISFHS